MRNEDDHDGGYNGQRRRPWDEVTVEIDHRDGKLIGIGGYSLD